MDRKERINEAYQYLYKKGIIHEQKDLAAIMKASKSNISSALSGKTSVLTDSFIRRFCDAFKGTFNENWLLKGEGEMLIEVKKEPMSLEERFDDLMKQQKQLLSILEADRDSYTRVIEKLANELADIKVTLRQMASGQPVQYYSVADGDVNPVNLNDPLNKLK